MSNSSIFSSLGTLRIDAMETTTILLSSRRPPGAVSLMRRSIGRLRRPRFFKLGNKRFSNNSRSRRGDRSRWPIVLGRQFISRPFGFRSLWILRLRHCKRWRILRLLIVAMERISESARHLDMRSRRRRRYQQRLQRQVNHSRNLCLR